MGKLKLFRWIDRKRFGINVLVVLILLKIFYIYIYINHQFVYENENTEAYAIYTSQQCSRYYTYIGE